MIFSTLSNFVLLKNKEKEQRARGWSLKQGINLYFFLKASRRKKKCLTLCC